MSNPNPCPPEPEEDEYDAWREHEEEYKSRLEDEYDNTYEPPEPKEERI